VTPKLASFNSRQVISILKRRGCALDRQSGSHAVFIHPDGRRTTAPIHGKRDLAKGIEIMRDAELTFDDRLKGRS
jgi:predicted RNA binding protein YcfA (HicA-like mRNA interferase family)